MARRSVFNLARGAGTALPLALLGPFLVRVLDAADFTGWALVLQLATYASFFDVGVQSAVATSTGRALGAGDRDGGRAVSAGIRLLSFAAAAAVLVVGFAAVVVPFVFDLDDRVRSDVSLGLLLLGLCFALALPGNAVHGALHGLGRNDLSAVVAVITRASGVIGAGCVAAAGAPIWAIAAVLGAGVAANGFVVMIVGRSIGLNVGLAAPPAAVTEVASLARTFGVLAVATLLINGVDTVVVGFFDIDSVGDYSLLVSFTGLVVMGGSIGLSVLLPAFSEVEASGRRDVVDSLLRSSIRVLSIVLSLAAVLAVMTGPIVMRLWVNSDDGAIEDALHLLLGASLVRLALFPVAQLLLALGELRIVRRLAIAEAAANLAFSVALGAGLGAAGVAGATLIASLGAALGFVMWGVRRLQLDARQARWLRSRLLVLAAVGLAAAAWPLLWQPLAVACMVGAVSLAVVSHRS